MKASHSAHIFAGVSPMEFCLKQNEVAYICNNLFFEGSSNQDIFHVITDSRYFTKFTSDQIDQACSGNKNIIILSSMKSDLSEKLLEQCFILEGLGRSGFSVNPGNGVYHGCSSAYVCLQLAVFNGAKQITIHGMKYDYGKNISRPSSENYMALPDVVISETIKCINDFALPKLESMNIKLYVQNYSILSKG